MKHQLRRVMKKEEKVKEKEREKREEREKSGDRGSGFDISLSVDPKLKSLGGSNEISNYPWDSVTLSYHLFYTYIYPCKSQRQETSSIGLFLTFGLFRHHFISDTISKILPIL